MSFSLYSSIKYQEGKYWLGEQEQGWISLDTEWIANHADTAKYEFIFISRSMENDGMMDYLNVMLIERSGDIAVLYENRYGYRVSTSGKLFGWVNYVLFTILIQYSYS